MVPLGLEDRATAARSGCSAGCNHYYSIIVVICFIKCWGRTYLSTDFVSVKISPCYSYRLRI
jgi:hypothetical protein